MDHLAKPPIKAGGREPWASYMKTIAQNKNVFCKLSGMVTEADWVHWKAEESASLPGCCIRSIWAGAINVWFGLAGVPVGRELSASEADHRELRGGKLWSATKKIYSAGMQFVFMD